jgi:protein arginine kinase activator
VFYSPFENTSNELNNLKEELAEDKLFFSEELTCKCCKTRLSDFLETGYVGCAQCYKIFNKDILNMLYDFHKAVKHVGKRPERIASKAIIQQEIDKLTAQQAEASASEDYLRAQAIKEKIAELKGEL